jgi:hypothetical protein
MVSPWYQGDIVLNTGSGDARTGDRTAPAPAGAITADGIATLGGSGGFGSREILIAGAIVMGAVLWRLSR